MAPSSGSQRHGRVVVRRATEVDIPRLVAHRIAMFEEMGDRSARAIARHAPAYSRWVKPRLRRAEVVAWVAEAPAGTPVGSGALWFQPSHPRPGFADLRVPYLLSIYTEPAARGRGVATAIVRQSIGLARRAGYSRVSLHASTMGRPLYERLGFRATTEMRLWLDPVQRRRESRRLAAESKGVRGPA